MNFDRHRRLRSSVNMRNMVRETALHKRDLIYPIFVVEKDDVKKEIPSMPGIYQLSLNIMDEEVHEAYKLGIRAVILFGIPNRKDACGTGAYDDEGIIQKATRKVKSLYPDMLVLADTCLCEYTDHGHWMNIHMMSSTMKRYHYSSRPQFLKQRQGQILLHQVI